MFNVLYFFADNLSHEKVSLVNFSVQQIIELELFINLSAESAVNTIGIIG